MYIEQCKERFSPEREINRKMERAEISCPPAAEIETKGIVHSAAQRDDADVQAAFSVNPVILGVDGERP